MAALGRYRRGPSIDLSHKPVAGCLHAPVCRENLFRLILILYCMSERVVFGCVVLCCVVRVVRRVGEVGRYIVCQYFLDAGRQAGVKRCLM